MKKTGLFMAVILPIVFFVSICNYKIFSIRFISKFSAGRLFVFRYELIQFRIEYQFFIRMLR